MGLESTNLHIDRLAVEQNLDMIDCIALMKQAQIDQLNKTAICPPRSFVPLAGSSQLIMMPAANTNIVGTKILTLFPSNAATELPVIQGLILLFDATTGSLLATVDAASITAIRTAAASAAATDALSNKSAKKLAIIGSGVQAKSHIDSMVCVRNLDAITIYSSNLTSAQQLAAETQDRLNIECRAVESPEKTIRGADIICTVSSSKKPIVDASWLSPGCHLNLVGAHSPEMREVDTETMKRATIFVEELNMALVEAGDITIPLASGDLKTSDIKGEIAEVYTGLKSGRTSNLDITLYKSLGNAIQDITAAYATYQSVTNPVN